MEAVKGQSPAPVASTKSPKLRYPLRSATKAKEEKAGMADLSGSSSSRRGRTASNVSKSVSALELSAKDKSAKPPRRLSIPSKSTSSPNPRAASGMTPISETRTKKTTTNSQAKSGTPKSDVSMSSVHRRKFSVLSSASYWVSQIKLSESAAKHSISLGFFKLALESGCEPLQRLKDELKQYVRRHNLLELGEPTKELLRSYNIEEDLEQVQASDTCSQVPDLSDEDGQVSSSVGRGSLKPKSMNLENVRASVVTKTTPKDRAQKGIPGVKNRASVNRNSANLSFGKDTSGNFQKKCQKPIRGHESNLANAKVSVKKSAIDKDSANSMTSEEEIQHEDKENMEIGEISATADV